MTRSVRDFGARGDGSTLDTHAIQDAIVACGADGGGAVYFPPGCFKSGTLFLQSNTRLLIEQGAVLMGTESSEDYGSWSHATGAPAPLICGENLENIAIEGGGTIDGAGHAFWTDERLHRNVRKPKPVRPPALIQLVNCRRVRMRDVRLMNSPCYTVWLMGCENGLIDGVTIDNPVDGPNTDGLDIDCCRDIRIANCSIRAGDDCIALKSDTVRLGENRACEDVVVTNCTLSSTACAIRVGYEGDGAIRNCLFDNLAIRDTDIGFDVISILPSDVPNITEGARIERITFSNSVMDNVNRPIYIWMGNETERPYGGAIQDITISNVMAVSRGAAFIGGTQEHAVESVALRSIRLAMTGRGDMSEVEVQPDVWGAQAPPHALICRHVHDLRINGLRLDWSRASGAWKSEMDIVDVDCFMLEGFQSEGFNRVWDPAARDKQTHMEGRQ